MDKSTSPPRDVCLQVEEDGDGVQKVASISRGDVRKASREFQGHGEPGVRKEGGYKEMERERGHAHGTYATSD